MRSFLNNLFRNFRTAQTARRMPRRANLQVEGLEQRDTPAVTYHGGAVLSHVEVQPLYLGSDWETNPTLLAQTTQFNSFLNTIVNSSYMDTLGSAYGSQTVDKNGNVVPPGTAGATVTPPIGRGTLSPMDLDPLGNLKTQFLTDSQIQGEILRQFTGGGLQMPINSGVADPNRLYVVFVEPGVAVSSGDQNSLHDFLGYHGDFAYQHAVLGKLSYIVTADIHYAVIPYLGSNTVLGQNLSFPWLGTFDGMTEVVSHELAESVTDSSAGNNDPILNANTNNKQGWIDDQYGQFHQGESEIGDIVSGQTVYLYGQYVVQRIADLNDQAMTPAGARATSAAPMDFVLKADGTFWVRNEAVSVGHATADVVGIGSNSGFIEEATGVASLSDQGVDNFGQAMVDVVFTNGTAAEYHAGSGNAYEVSPWVYLPMSGVKQAKAGQGVSYVLTTNGDLFEYTDFNAGTGTGRNATLLDSNVQSIDAGTDAHGVSMVAYVRTDWYTRWVYFNGQVFRESYSQSDAFERSDSTGQPHLIGTNVQSVSAGQQGNIAYVTTSGAAFWYSESTNSSTFEASGVAAITAGTDNSGYLLLDMLFTNGRVSQDEGGVWSSLTSSVASIGKARAGVLDVVFNGGSAYTYDLYSTNGWSFLLSNATTAA
jgi:hypothetical protein